MGFVRPLASNFCPGTIGGGGNGGVSVASTDDLRSQPVYIASDVPRYRPLPEPISARLKPQILI